METNVAQLVAVEFKVEVSGGPERFASSGWFSVGMTGAECPNCKRPLLGYRKPYNPKPCLTYHYWALACLECRQLFEPADLDEASRRLLSKPERRRPESGGGVGAQPAHAKTQAHYRSQLCRRAQPGAVGEGRSHAIRAETEEIKESLLRNTAGAPGDPPETPVGGCEKKPPAKGSADLNAAPPAHRLAERVVQRLVGEKLLTPQLGKHLLPKLAEGKMMPDDWRLPIELSDPEEDPW